MKISKVCFSTKLIFIYTNNNYIIQTFLNSLPNDKILDLSKLKAFADDNLNIYQKQGPKNFRILTHLSAILHLSYSYTKKDKSLALTKFFLVRTRGQVDSLDSEKLNFALGRVENIVGKGENADYLHFLLFPQFFERASFLWSLKVRIVLEGVEA